MSRLDRYFADVAAIRATGTSTDRWITVTRAPDGDLDVQIGPGMLRRLTDNEIALDEPSRTYLPVEPLLIAEIVVDQAYEGGRWRHPVRHLRLRPDLQPSDVSLWSSSEPDV